MMPPMTTTSQQLDDFAATCEAATVWTPDLQTQLMDLIREPALTLLDQVIPVNDRTKAMDNIYRCKPRGWIREEQELPTGFSVANFSLWVKGSTDVSAGLKMSVGVQKTCQTLALAMLAATARVWSYLLRQAGR